MSDKLIDESSNVKESKDFRDNDTVVSPTLLVDAFPVDCSIKSDYSDDFTEILELLGADDFKDSFDSPIAIPVRSQKNEIVTAFPCYEDEYIVQSLRSDEKYSFHRQMSELNEFEVEQLQSYLQDIEDKEEEEQNVQKIVVKREDNSKEMNRKMPSIFPSSSFSTNMKSKTKDATLSSSTSSSSSQYLKGPTSVNNHHYPHVVKNSNPSNTYNISNTYQNHNNNNSGHSVTLKGSIPTWTNNNHSNNIAGNDLMNSSYKSIELQREDSLTKLKPPMKRQKLSQQEKEKSSLSRRQVATAKREREHGKFKRNTANWVSITDLFGQ
jgi:hypothetical protein